MQTQKNEIREKMIAVAEIEFLNKGFKNASMRTIAKKAHTTLGNIYNYFESKEAILDAVMGDIPERVEEMMKKHQKEAVMEKIPEQPILSQLEELVPEVFEFDILLSRPFMILMEGCKGTKYEAYSKKFYNMVHSHIEEHLRKEDELMGEIISKSLMTSLLCTARSKVAFEEKKKALLKYIEIITLGILSSQVHNESSKSSVVGGK